MRYYIIAVILLSLFLVGISGFNSWGELLCVFGIGIVFWGAMLCPMLIKSADE